MDQQPRRSTVGLRLALALVAGLVASLGTLWAASLSSGPTFMIPLAVLALTASGLVAAMLRPDRVGFVSAWLGERTVPIVVALTPDADSVGDVGRLGYMVIVLGFAAIMSVPLAVGFVVGTVLRRS
jgi:hypothetical protein